MSRYADLMSTFAISELGPKEATIEATVSTVTYDSEQYHGLTPSLTLLPGGCDKSVISLHFPGEWPLGMTPNLLTCRLGETNGPGDLLHFLWPDSPPPPMLVFPLRACCDMSTSRGIPG